MTGVQERICAFASGSVRAGISETTTFSADWRKSFGHCLANGCSRPEESTLDLRVSAKKKRNATPPPGLMADVTKNR